MGGGKIPNKDLMSIKSQLSHVQQTIRSANSPTERYEVDRAIQQEHSTSVKQGVRSAQQDAGSYIKPVVDFSENEGKSRWELISAKKFKEDQTSDV